MKQNKFRVFFYDGENESEGKYVSLQEALEENYVVYSGNALVPFDECAIIEQYTGLKDWYEGDLIIDKYGNQAVIVFKNASFQAEPINNGTVCGSLSMFDRKIGNIHES